MQIGQEVGGPCDGVRLSGSGRVLNQELAARAFFQNLRLQLAGRVQLMVSREDRSLQSLLFITFCDQIPAKNFQPAVTLPDVFPQIGRHEAVRIVRISPGTIVSFVERQKLGVIPVEPRCHANFAVADSEMNQSPAREAQERFR